MKRILPCLATLALGILASPAWSQPYDPIGDVISAASESAIENASDWALRATLYHGGGGMSSRDSLGCHVSPMRTVAVDPRIVSRRTIIFIKETVGLVLPDGSIHDGYWYASDIGPAIRGSRIDLFTGSGAGSMRPLQTLNLKTLTVSKAGSFSGCPPMDGGSGSNVAMLTGASSAASTAVAAGAAQPSTPPTEAAVSPPAPPPPIANGLAGVKASGLTTVPSS
jgi:3D (Asp-Asp-Asp) domain-containing protein